MSFNKILCTGALSVLPFTLSAQEFTGGTLGLEYLSTDGDDVTSYYGEVEFGINRNIGFEVDLNGFSAGSDSASSATMHGIYHIGPTASLGAYYGQGFGDSNDVTFYGVEGGTLWGRTSIGGYLGQRESGGTSGTTFGVNAEAPINDSFEIFTDFDFIYVDDSWVSQDEIGVQYNMPNGPELYALYGRASAELSGFGGATADYFGVGARINFGAKRGTTFEGR